MVVSSKGIISHGQAHESMLQIENALKNAGIAPGETISNLIKMNFFFDKISEEFEINSKLKLLKKTGILKTIIPPFDEKLKLKENLFNFFKPLFKRERKKGNPDPFIGNDVFNKFADEQVVQRSCSDIQVTCFLYKVQENCSSKKVAEEYMSFDLDKNILSFISALSITLTAIISGELDAIGSQMEVGFKGRDNELYCFNVTRKTSGGIQIFICEKNGYYFSGMSTSLFPGSIYIF